MAAIVALGGTMSTNIVHLPRAERIKHYFALAQEERRQASMCSGAAQAALIRSAAQWEQLAREVENPTPRTPG